MSTNPESPLGEKDLPPKEPLDSNKNPKPQEAPHEKRQDTHSSGLYDYARSNTKDTIAYVILVVGIIMLFFEPFFGEVLIGIMIGLYFSEEIDYLVKNGNAFIEKQGMVRSIVLGVVALAFLIAAPGIYVGALLAALLKYLFGNNITPINKP